MVINFTKILSKLSKLVNFSKKTCLLAGFFIYCAKVKQTLKEKGYAFEEIVLGKNATVTSIRAITGRDTAPQIFIGGKHIGGNDDLQAYFAK